MSSYRPPSGYGNPPGTGRLVSGRLVSGAAGGGYQGVGLATQVKVADRPVTRGGVAGMESRLQSAGPGRQVYDLSYFIGLIRQRCGDLTREIAKLGEEIQRRTRDAKTMESLEREYDDLIGEVRQLEGELADYNLAMDKSRAGTDPSELRVHQMNLKARNAEEAHAVDSVFLERREREEGIKRMEEAIEGLHKQAEARLATLPPALQQEYRQLQDNNKKMEQQVTQLQSELERVNGAVQEAEEHLRRDRNRQEYAGLERKLHVFKREQSSLEEQRRIADMDPAEARQKILQKVKQDVTRIQSAEAQIQELQQQLDHNEQAVRELDAAVEQRKNGQGDGDKYEELFKHDAKMTAVLDSFPGARQRELDAQGRHRETVVALLEHVSVEIEREHAMPTRDQAKEMASDVDDKKRELGASKTTMERLREELKKRQSELSKITTLDEKIELELRSLRAKMATMKAELEVYEDLDALRTQSETTTAELKQHKQNYSGQLEAVNPKVAEAAQEFRRLEKQLAENPKAQELVAAEKKVRSHEQQIFAMKDFIASKAVACDYSTVKAEVLGLATEVNEQIRKVQAEVRSAGLASGAY